MVEIGFKHEMQEGLYSLLLYLRALALAFLSRSV
jgi:hypothetical protein